MSKSPKIEEPNFDKLLEFDNFYQAYIDARKCKRYRSSILKFSNELGKNLVELQNELKRKTYKHGGYREFIVNDSKKRLIKAAPFRDRVVHHAICNIIEPIIDKGFIYDSYACRKEKGVHSAILRLEYFIKSLSSCTPAESGDSAPYVEGGHERPSFAEATGGEGEREREREREAPHKIYCLK